MGRRRLSLTVVAAVVLGSTLGYVAPAHADVVVHVDEQYARWLKKSEACNAGHTDCVEQYSGPGVTASGRVRWKLDMSLEILAAQPLCGYYPRVQGTFTLARVGSADSVSGTVPGTAGRVQALIMKVTSGTGAYAGMTDASATGTAQAFSHPTVDYVYTGVGPIDDLVLDTIYGLLSGCLYDPFFVLSNDYLGSLDFHLV